MNEVIGILGGGQLGRMLAEAASPLDINLRILDADLSYPAAAIVSDFKLGDFTNFDDVLRFGQGVDILTIEIESVNTDALHVLENEGKKVYPQPAIIDLIKDKGKQKSFYKDNSIPTSPFTLLSGKDDLIIDIESGKLVLPFVVKLRQGGYDGKGVFVIHHLVDLEDIPDAPILVESKVDVATELAVVVCRGQDGQMVHFPPVEMQFHPTANLVEFLFSPSYQPKEIQDRVVTIALDLAEKLGIVGLLAVELFVDIEGHILVNEVAPRPHNSSHHTIEANACSQFEQHLRAICGLPLGSTKMISPAVMINVLGEPGHSGKVKYEGLEQALAMDGVYPHLYGKKMTKPFRKMGHITILDDQLEVAIEKARAIQRFFKVVSIE